MQEFAIRHDTWYKWMAVVCGLLPQWSWVAIEGDLVVVQMSYAFRSTFDRSAVRSVTPWTGRVWSWGVHGWRKRWLVNGSSQGIVVLALDPPAKARVLGWPIHVRELAVSLDDPVGLAAALGTELAPTSC